MLHSSMYIMSVCSELCMYTVYEFNMTNINKISVAIRLIYT